MTSINNLINENSNVRIQWSDKRENHTKEREKQIIAYIKNKYKLSVNPRVDFLATNRLNIGITDLNEEDVVNINRPETQEKIIYGWLRDNDVDIKLDDIMKLNKKVETLLEEVIDIKDNKWTLKNISFENFLSYKEKTVIDFEKLKGLTLIQGKNFAGKTSILEALIFLFYNTTSKTKVADEVINTYVNTDFARVTAELIIEGIEYLIERTVKRIYKKNKIDLIKTVTILKIITKDGSGQYPVDENGEYIEDEVEENRNANEKKIKENIGNMDEFIMTVMCTGDNMFDIVKALPTKRGQLLSRFLGLEIFEKKEKIGKDIFDEWKGKSKINKYTSSDLEKTNEENLLHIKSNEETILELNKELTEIIVKKNQVVKEKEEFLTYMNKDIDSSMSNLDENYFINKISNLNKDLANKKIELKEAKDKLHPVTEEFNQDEYKKHTDNKSGLERKIILLENDIKKNLKDIDNLKNGEKCSECGQSLKDVDHTAEIEEKKIKDLSFKALLGTYKNELNGLLPLIEKLEDIHEKIRINDNLTLKKDKIEVEIERFDLSITAEETKLEKYKADINKIKVNKDLEEKIRLKNIEITQETNNENSKKREIQTLENTNETLNKSFLDNVILIDVVKKEEHIAKVFSTYINMMGKNGISKTIIKNSVPALNLELSRLMSDSAEFTVEIDVNIKNNEVEFWMIDNETEKRKRLISGSGYEKTIAVLALKFVFTKINTLPKPSLFLADEIFSTVHIENLELIKIFLDKVSQTIDNLFIITHNELVKEWAQNIITITKENNISKISY